jgi:hypothetical protein
LKLLTRRRFQRLLMLVLLLQIRRPKSYGCWLKEKARAASQKDRAREGDAEDEDLSRQEEVDAAFRTWLRNKRTGKKENTSVESEPKRWCKPPSLHVNPKVKKSSTRKAELAVAASGSAPCFQRGRTEVESQRAYEAWLARVRKEDHVRRAQSQQTLRRLEQQQREKHLQTWRRKLAVCAYSTLAVDSWARNED